MRIVQRIVIVIAVVAVVATFTGLGLWQLSRNEQMRAHNTRLESRMELPALSASDVFTSRPDEIEYRRVSLVGTYDTPREVVVTGKAYRSAAGDHVVTPLIVAGGRAILVDRGWIPLASNDPPVEGVSPPESDVRIEGVVLLSERRTRLAPKLPPEGELRRVVRLDVPRLSRQFPYDVAPVWLHLTAQDPSQASSLPRIVPLPRHDPGPHLSYAIQWFLFATVTVVGSVAIWLRRRGHAASGDRRDPETQEGPSVAPLAGP